jgi:glycosyltransferase involved in cell wall biosynthesis
VQDDLSSLDRQLPAEVPSPVNQAAKASSFRSPGSRPRLGVLATHAIQYQAPLYQELSRRAVVDLEVAFLSKQGANPFRDPGFGVPVAWDIDLLGGYRWSLLAEGSRFGTTRWLSALTRWLRSHDIVVLHGHSKPEMLLAGVACRALHVPYLLRGESHAQPTAASWRRVARHMVASFSVSGAAGALPIGELNAAFYERYGKIPHFRAPYSVDSERFRTASDAARKARTDRLTSLGLDPARPTVIFSGKLTSRKRPLDAVLAIGRCDSQLNLLLLGDGPLRQEISHFEGRLPVRGVGFVNQTDLPGWYSIGDVLVLPSDSEPWGVVVNEAMACGLVPVVSDAVGCAPDLVDGVGEIFPVGDIDELTRALLRASGDASARGERIRNRLERYTISETARGYEQAALACHR